MNSDSDNNDEIWDDGSPVNNTGFNSSFNIKRLSSTDSSSRNGISNRDRTALGDSDRQVGADLLESSPFALRRGRALIWKNVSMSINATKKEPERKILDNVYGQVPSAHMTAIMGPSGSGKTSLLNVLSGRAGGNRITLQYDVRVNNYTVDPKDVKVRQAIAFVAQDDSLQVTATPREAILFSAKLRLPRHKISSTEELVQTTDLLLEKLGLMDCADTMIGGTIVKGISGGERKRTSVAVELVTQPAMIFLDEPTSGLDSFNALQLCRVLQKVANAGSSVLFTIHQPSSDIFNNLDRLILLNKGRVMYQGSVGEELATFFEERGHPMPPNFNPSDHIMSVALSIPINQLIEDKFFPEDTTEYVQPLTLAGKEEMKDVLGISHNNGDQNGNSRRTVGIFIQTQLLFKREVRNLYRNTQALRARMAMTTLISLLIGFLFYKVAETDFNYFINVQSTFGALLMSLLANVFSTVLPSLVSFPEERPVFIREYSTKHYSVTSYLISKLTMETMVTALQVSISTIITYFLVGYSAKFGTIWSCNYILALCATALGTMIGCAVKEATVAIELLPSVFMPQILFSGFFVPPDLIPSWLSWISYICPLTYATRLVLIAEFGHGRCDGLESPVNFCEQVLTNVNADPDETWWYWLVLVCLFVFFRFLGIVILRQKASAFN